MGLNQYVDDDLQVISPFGFDIDSVQLQTNSGHKLEMKTLVQQVIITETLYTMGIMVQIFVRDTTSLFTKAKLAGNERIRLSILREEPTEGLQGFFLELYITDISKYSQITPTESSYELLCMSKHNYLNNKKLLNTSFDGSVEKLIGNIVKSKEILDTKFTPKATGTKQLKGIYPNLKPYDAINWLLRNATDNDTPMYFYETAAEGLCLNSYNNIIKEDIFRSYNKFPFFETSLFRSEAEAYFLEEQARIQRVGSSLGISKLTPVENGVIGGVVNTIDISNKKPPRKIEYRYVNDKPKANLNNEDGNHTPIESEMTIDEKSIDTFKDSHQQFISLNSLAFSGTNDKASENYHTAADGKRLYKSNAITNNLNSLKLKLLLAGDFQLSPGKTIFLDFLTGANIEQELEEGTEFNDEYLSGRYLVTGVEHTFSLIKGYRMRVTGKKDSFLLEKAIDNFSPSFEEMTDLQAELDG